jgi:ComF family protein
MAFFEGGLREAIHRFKYQHRTELAGVFGAMLNDYLNRYPLPIHAVIPVPLHPERERRRGYNQALLLARELAARQNLPLWYNVLARVRATQPQVELDARARRENVQDAFAASDAVAGASVLLIDDVCTTGATLDACSVALKQRGAKSVWGLALARGR